MLGYQLTFIAFTDHKDNTINGLKVSERILRLPLSLEEYVLTFEYLLGKTKKKMMLLRMLYPFCALIA
jgi:hypothetical protein